MKPFDLTKLNKMLDKKGLSTGFFDPRDWIDTGNYALNYCISSSFFKGIPLGKVSVFAGESGSGKSYIASGNLIRNAHKAGVTTIILDSEYALDREWMENLGVDTSSPLLSKASVSLVDDCAAAINEVMDGYVKDFGDLPYEERPKILFVIDSLGMLSTPTEVDQFQKNEMKGDMGRKAKQLKALVTQALKMFGPHPIGLVATNHTYKSQDMFSPDDVVSGGAGFVYASSIVVTMNKLKLKEDAEGNKTGQVHGIRSKMKCIKSRYAKPFEEVEIEIPWTTGMNPYSGLLDLFTKMGVVTKDGNKLKYVADDGTEFKHFEKAFKRDTELLDRIMREVESRPEATDTSGVDELPEEDNND